MAVHFWIDDFSYYWDGDTFVVATNSPMPMHQYARYTDVSPQLHIVPRMRRGIALKDDLYPCFVGYKQKEQREAGDTWAHTYDFSEFLPGQTFWVYFIGQISGEWSKSSTPWFMVTVPEKPAPSDWPYTGTFWNWPFYVSYQGTGVLRLVLKDTYSAPFKACSYVTTDGGLNWSLEFTSQNVGNSFEQCVKTSSSWVVCSDYPIAIYQSSNKTSWTSRLSNMYQAGYLFTPLGGSSRVWCSGNTPSSSPTRSMYFSTNDGITWNYCNGSGNIRGQRFAINSGASKAVVSGNHPSTFPTVRGSNNPTSVPGTWSSLGWGQGCRRMGMELPNVVSPRHNGDLHFDYSTDYGATYSTKSIPSGMSAAYATFPDVALQGNNVYALSCNFSTPGLWYSSDFGNNWNHVASGFGDNGGHEGIIAEPSTPGTLYAWGKLSGFTVSTDYGQTWQRRNRGLEVGQW